MVAHSSFAQSANGVMFRYLTARDGILRHHEWTDDLTYTTARFKQYVADLKQYKPKLDF